MTLQAAPAVITVGDFTVESRNPSCEFLGKGLSRLVAGDLRKSGAVKLTERENLQKLLEEQEFSMSDLADPDKQLKIGALLAARYVVIGEIDWQDELQ